MYSTPIVDGLIKQYVGSLDFATLPRRLAAVPAVRGMAPVVVGPASRALASLTRRRHPRSSIAYACRARRATDVVNTCASPSSVIGLTKCMSKPAA